MIQFNELELVQIGKAFSRFRKETAERTDDRIKMINEIIPSMRILKMYAWEKPFLQFVQVYRNLEMKVIRRTSYLRAFNVTLFCMSAKLVIFPTLVTFVLLGNELTPNKVIYKHSVSECCRLELFLTFIGFLDCCHV